MQVGKFYWDTCLATRIPPQLHIQLNGNCFFARPCYDITNGSQICWFEFSFFYSNGVKGKRNFVGFFFIYFFFLFKFCWFLELKGRVLLSLSNYQSICNIIFFQTLIVAKTVKNTNKKIYKRKTGKRQIRGKMIFFFHIFLVQKEIYCNPIYSSVRTTIKNLRDTANYLIKRENKPISLSSSEG